MSIADIHFGIGGCSPFCRTRAPLFERQKQLQRTDDDLDHSANRRRAAGALRDNRGEQGEQHNGDDDAGYPTDHEPNAGALRMR